MATETFECPLTACSWQTTEDTTCEWCQGQGRMRAGGMGTKCNGCHNGKRYPLEAHLKWSHTALDFVVEIRALREQLERLKVTS